MVGVRPRVRVCLRVGVRLRDRRAIRKRTPRRVATLAAGTRDVDAERIRN
ncbi:hypothetical protein ABT294_00410 [Nonomuraea sp. NPDC000554]